MGPNPATAYTQAFSLKRLFAEEAQKAQDADDAREREMRVTVQRVIYYNDTNAYAVLSCDVTDGERGACVTGTFPGVREGAALLVTGRWDRHPKYGRQFVCRGYEEEVPSSADAIRKYLGSGQVEGIGPVLAERLVDAFGDDTFDVIERHPERLQDIPGIGKKKAAAIVAHWDDHKSVREIMVFLKGHDVPNTFAAKIYDRYGNDAIRVLTETPYQMAYDIRGVGFRKADDLAMRLGVDRLSPERLKCGLLYALEKARGGGNMYLPREGLIREAAKKDIFGEDGPSRERLSDAINALARDGRVALPDRGEGEDAVYLPQLLRAEQRAAAALAALAQRHDDGLPPQLFDNLGGIQYAPLQQRAIHMAATAGCCIITGGPGTGKTTTVRGILAALHAAHKRVLLASPTGKAAKRLEEATGQKASTIHRLLEYSPNKEGFMRNADNPLDGDVLIVDEASMVDTPLLDTLLRAVPPHMHVVFVGDADQLPSVGPGNTLQEMLASGAIPTVRLNDIFRQALDSDIIRGAHAINAGRRPEIRDDKGDRKDLWFAARFGEDATADAIITYLKHHIAAGSDLSDTQVLSPMKRGACGTEALNRRIQALVNPDGAAVVKGPGWELRIGDRVINTHNNYTYGIFNGDQGVITGQDAEACTFDVDFDGNVVTLRKVEADTLIHAWAITVHRSQGSEFDTVVVALSNSHAHMLQRQILYTAVTRAKKRCVMVGEDEALGKAVRTNTMRRRCSRLARLVAAAAAGEAAAEITTDFADEDDPFGGVFD